MKEDLKTVLYMGLGAISETNEKMKEITDSLYDKGRELYEKGVIKNEELRHNINEMMREKDSCGGGCCCHHGEDERVNHIVNKIKSLDDEEQREIMNKMGWICECDEGEERE